MAWDGHKGVLCLKRKQNSVKEENIVLFIGSYLPENHKEAYSIKGNVEPKNANKIIFTIHFPVPQKFIGYLMSKTKDTITGHTVDTKPVGFYAVRIAPISQGYSKKGYLQGAPVTQVGIVGATGRALSQGKMKIVWEYGDGRLPRYMNIDIYSEGESILLDRYPVMVHGTVTATVIEVKRVFHIPHEIIFYVYYPDKTVPKHEVYIANCRIGKKATCTVAKYPAPIINVDIPKAYGERISFASILLTWEYGEGELPVYVYIDVQRDSGTVLPRGELIRVDGKETQKEFVIWRLFDLPHDIIFHAQYPQGTIPRQKTYIFRQNIMSR
jgi:hypothetical protein